MVTRAWLFLLLTLPALAQKVAPPTLHPNPAAELRMYHNNLAELRREYSNHQELPDLRFFLFGMGNRLKLIYRNGRLLNALTGNIEEQWAVRQELIVPSAYLVHLVLENGQIVQIREDETGVWLLQPAKRPRLIPGTRSRLNLPDFARHRFGPVLRVLHQEVLINVLHGRPLPNFLVYQQPRYHPAALMGMVLRQTRNLPLLQDWIMALRDPFEGPKRGVADADNLGEVLFLVSLVADRTHPVVQMALDSASGLRKGTYISGKTDKADHPVYQTKWLKYGLKSLNLPDSYTIPKLTDSYSSLFWLDYTTEPAGEAGTNRVNEQLGVNTPWLTWAEDHFYNEKRGLLATPDYPLSWEQQSSEAHYPGLTVLDKDLVKQKLAFPHAGHAAEMFLRLSNQ